MTQPVTPADVVAVYRSVLGREPENSGIVDDFVALGVTLEDMITQALQSDEFSARTGVLIGGYSGPPIPQLVPPLHRRAGQPRVAVLVRSHLVDAKFDHLWAALGAPDEARPYDVFPLLDGDALLAERAEVEARYPSVIWTSDEDVRAAGLTQRSTEHNNLWLLGDLPLYLAMLQRPEYDYYVMVEFDVHFTRGAKAYMERLCARLLAGGEDALDAVGLEYSALPHSAERPREGWPFFPPAVKAFPHVYHFYFPIVAASRQSLLHAFAGRQLEAARQTPSEDLVLCEAYLPSALKAAGFNCQDFNAVLPGSYRSETMGLQHYSPGRLTGLPLSHALARPDESVEMVHAVYSDEYFLHRGLQRAWSSPDDLRTYLRDVPGRFGEVLAPDLLDGYVERAERRAAELGAAA